MVYDNSVNDLGVFLTHPTEFGDEIDFAGSGRILTSMTFTLVGEAALPAAARARIRLYRNDGPLLPTTVPIATPGTLLYQSDAIPVRQGVWPLEIVDIAVPVPDRITWTVEFTGVGTQVGTRAGLQVYHPPVVGHSFRDYWARSGDGFQIYVLESGVSASFAARFEAIPDPPVSLTTTPLTGDRLMVTVSGPIGSEHVLEASDDGQHWNRLAVLSLATTPAASYIETNASPNPDRQYRSQPAQHPGETAILLGLRREASGVNTLTLIGSPDSSHVLETSTDHRAWQTLGLLRFGKVPLTFVDNSAAHQSQRYYRTRRPEGARRLYRVASVARSAEGAATVHCVSTAAGGKAILQSSSDGRTWTDLGEVPFTTPEADYLDETAVDQAFRLYRLMAP